MCTDWKDLKKDNELIFCKLFLFVQICCALCSLRHRVAQQFDASVAQLSLFNLGLFIFFKQEQPQKCEWMSEWLQCRLTVQILLSFSSRLSVCVLAETVEIQEMLTDHGISVQTMSEVLPIRVLPARILSHVYVKLGKRRFLPDCMSVCNCSSNPCARQETARSWI